MYSGSEAGSYPRLIDCVYHSTLGLRVIKKKKFGGSPHANSIERASLDLWLAPSLSLSLSLYHATEKNPVSAYDGSSKNLKDLKDNNPTAGASRRSDVRGRLIAWRRLGERERERGM